MAEKFGWLVGVVVGFGLISACGGTSTTTKGNTVIACEPGAQRCDGNDIKRCEATVATKLSS